jgi:hypothetical protein
MRYCLLFLSAVFLLVSCEKTKTPETKQDTLRDGKWWVDTMAIVYHIPYRDTDSVYGIGKSTLPDCRLDDRIIFREGTSGVHVTNEEKCAAELEEYEFTWGITENDTKMYFYNMKSILGDDVNATLKEFTDNKFVIVYERYKHENQGDDKWRIDTSEYTVTFVKK